MKRVSTSLLCVAVYLTSLTALAQGGGVRLFDAGPVATPADSTAANYTKVFFDLPDFRAMGMSLEAGGKFRPAFGPTFYRGDLRRNQVKILVIGQDATHIAEAAGRTFTGGTGGRLQHIVDFLGVTEKAFFINTFAYTIRGQFGDFQPVIDSTDGGQGQVRFLTMLSPSLYSLAMQDGKGGLTNDPVSPIVEWRNRYLDQIIEANQQSLKLIILVGGAAVDTLGTYINSRGGNLARRFDTQTVLNLSTIKTTSLPLGGNRSLVVPVDSANRPITMTLQEMGQINDKHRRAQGLPGITDPVLRQRAQTRADLAAQAEINDLNRDRISQPQFFSRLVRVTNGPFKNGVFHPGQFGFEMRGLDGAQSSMAGLTTKTGVRIPDIRFLQIPHPGSLRDTLEGDIAEALDKIKTFSSTGPRGWNLTPDAGAQNQLGNTPFDFVHGEIPPKDFPFGKTSIVISNSSNARRGVGPQVAPGQQRSFDEGVHIIQIGGRASGRFPNDVEKKMMAALPAECANLETVPVAQRRARRTPECAALIPSGERPWEPARAFDSGPGAFAQALTVPASVTSATLTGVNAELARDIRDRGASGMYRGKLGASPVLILADSFDVDDLTSARALTGEVGQKLHGFLNGIKFKASATTPSQSLGDKYVILKAAPFDMTGASEQDWRGVLTATRAWRTGAIRRLITPASGETAPKLILTFGPRSQDEMKQIPHGTIKVVNIDPTFADNLAAIQEIAATPGFEGSVASNFTALSIPRTHLPYGQQHWVGTSGNRVLRGPRVIMDTDNVERIPYEIVVPKWVLNPALIGAPTPSMTRGEPAFIRTMCQKFQAQGFTACPTPREENDADGEEGGGV